MTTGRLLFFISVFISCICLSSNILAQKKSSVVISGTVTDISGGKKIQDIRISVYNLPSMAFVDSARTSDEGDYKFKFETDKEYVLFFEKRGYIRKKLLLNSSFPNSSGKIITNYFDYSFQMSNKISSNFGGELLDKPVIKISFNYQQKLFDFDPDYAVKLKRELAALSPDQIEKLTAKLENQAKGLPEEKKPATAVAPVKPTSPIATTTSKPVDPKTPDKKATTTPVTETKPKTPETPKNPVAVTTPVKEPEKKPIATPKTPTEIKPEVKESKTVETLPKSDLKDYISIPEIKAIAANASKADIAKIELKRLEESNRKTVLEIVDRKDIIFEKFLQQKLQKNTEKLKRKNLKGKYETGNPLTSFYDANDLYELELKNKKLKKQ